MGLTDTERQEFVDNLDIVSVLNDSVTKGGLFKSGPCPICDGTGVMTSPNREDGYMHSSEMTKCSRRLFYTWRKTERKYTQGFEPAQAAFDIGTAVHLYVQSLFYKAFYNSPVKFTPEIRILPPLSDKDLNGVIRPKWPPISGHCDGLLEHERFRIGLEIKTINKLTDVATAITKPYLVQQSCYCRMLNLPGMMFLFIEKSFPHKLYQVFCGYNKGVWEPIERRLIKIVDDWVIHNKLPPKDVPDTECETCFYNHTCSKK